jgi:hypothetical protein
VTAAQRLKAHYELALENSLDAVSGSASVSRNRAAYLPLHLIAGDAQTCRADHSRQNALLAVMEVFGTAVGEPVARRLGISCNVPGKTFEAPRAVDGATSLSERIAELSPAHRVDPKSDGHP